MGHATMFRKLGKGTLATAGLVGSAAGIALAQSAERLQPGLWEAETHVTEITWGNLAGDRLSQAQRLKAEQQGRRMTATECLTADEVNSRYSGISLGNGDCQFERFAMADGRLSAQGKCIGTPDGDVTMIISGEYSPTMLDTFVDMSYEQPGQPGGIAVKLRSVRTRIGNCPGVAP